MLVHAIVIKQLICSGLEAQASNFFIYLLTIVLTSLAASGVAFMYSALVDVFALANIMTAFTYVIMMVRMLMYVSVYAVRSM